MDLAFDPALKIFPNLTFVLALGQFCSEPIGIEIECVSVLDEFGVRKPVLVLIEPVVHRPEGALSAGGFGGVFCVRMDIGKREMPVDVLKSIAQAPHTALISG